eukprot:7025702-Prymnesium_polylepis.1
MEPDLRGRTASDLQSRKSTLCDTYRDYLSDLAHLPLDPAFTASRVDSAQSPICAALRSQCFTVRGSTWSFKVDNRMSRLSPSMCAGTCELCEKAELRA